MKEEMIDPCYSKYLLSMNLDSNAMGSSQDEPPLPHPDIATPDKFQGTPVYDNLILMPPPSFAMSPVVKAPSTAWAHTLDALPDTTYMGLMDIPAGNPTCLPKGSTSNDAMDKVPPPKSTSSNSVTHTKSVHPSTSDTSNPLAKVTLSKGNNTPRDPKR